MTWNVERTVDLGLSTPNDIVWDGRFVWVSYNNETKLLPFEILDRSQYDDTALIAGYYGEERQEEFLNPISSLDIKSIDIGGFWIAPYLNGCFISSSKTFTTINFVNSVSGEYSEIVCPDTMTSNLLCCNNKLWMTSLNPGGDKLHIYDIITTIWSSSTIPVREQETPRHLSHDKNGHVLITNFNNASICKYDVSGSFVEEVEMYNKEPIYTFTDENRNTFVASYNGMISLFDTNADLITSFAYNGHGADSSMTNPLSSNVNIKDLYFTNFWGFESDTDYLWVSTMGTAFNRIDIATKDVIGTEAGDPVTIPSLISTLSGDFDGMIVPTASPTTILEDNGDGTYTEKGISVADNMDENTTLNPPATGLFKKLVLVPMMTKQIWNGSDFETKTYPKQIVLATSTGVYAFPNEKFWRSNFVEVEAVAMISSGPFDYTGD